MQRRFAFFTATAMLLAGEAPAQDPIKQDIKILNGEWRLVSAELGGKPLAEENRIRLTGESLQFASNKFTVRYLRPKPVTWHGTFDIDPTAVPKALNIHYADGVFEGSTLRLIYKVDGDTLTICQPRPGQERPETFSTNPKNPKAGIVLFVYARVTVKAQKK